MRWFGLSFAPKTQVSRTICMAASREASTKFSPDVALLTLRSPSFKSQHLSYLLKHFQDHGMYTDTCTHTYTYTNTYTCTYPYIHISREIFMYMYIHISIYTCYHESSRTQPQMEWKCDVSVLCVLFVCACLLCVCTLSTHV